MARTDDDIGTASAPASSGPVDTIDIAVLACPFRNNPHRVFPIEYGGRRLWVKRIRKNLPNPAGLLRAARAPLAEAALRAYGPGVVRRALYALTVLFFDTYAALYPFRNIGKREIRQTHACIRAIHRAPRKRPGE